MSKALQILKSEKKELETELRKIEKAIEVLERDSAPRSMVRPTDEGKKKHLETLLDLIGKEPGLSASEMFTMLGHSSEGYTYNLLRSLTRAKAIHHKHKDGKRRYYLGEQPK